MNIWAVSIFGLLRIMLLCSRTSFCVEVFISPTWVPRNGTVQPHDSSILLFLRDWQTILCSHQQCMRVAFLCILTKHNKLNFYIYFSYSCRQLKCIHLNGLWVGKKTFTSQNFLITKKKPELCSRTLKKKTPTISFCTLSQFSVE